MSTAFRSASSTQALEEWLGVPAGQPRRPVVRFATHSHPTRRRSDKRDAYPTRRGLTIIELLITIAILGILAAAIVPQITSDIPERLTAAGQVVVADLDYARSLAVANNTKYRLTFEPAQNRYYLQHSGTNALFNVLPASPFRQATDSASKQTTDLSALPIPAPRVRLVAVLRMQAGGVTATDLEFTPLGGITAAYEHQLWLACGSGASQRFISILVNPVTGLAQSGPVKASLPAAVASVAGS